MKLFHAYTLVKWGRALRLTMSHNYFSYFDTYLHVFSKNSSVAYKQFNNKI